MIFIDSLNGYRYDLISMGIHPLKLIPDSLSPRHETEVIEGMDGHIDIETTYEGRTLSAHFFVEAKEDLDYNAIRGQVFQLFNGKTYFYVIDEKAPDRRWKVRTASKFTPEKLSLIAGSFTVELVSATPFAESINLVEYKYINNFSFNNIGDESIDLRTQNETEIEFKGVSNGLTIHNKTTGDIWSYSGATTANDTVLLKGIRSTKNGVSIFGQTNKKILTFAPGWNDFEILGSTDFTLTIRTRFYFI